jgi:hypothetical protein
MHSLFICQNGLTSRLKNTIIRAIIDILKLILNGNSKNFISKGRQYHLYRSKLYSNIQKQTKYDQLWANIQYVSKLQRLNSNVYKFYNNKYIFCVGVICTQVNMMFVMLPWVYISTLGKLDKYAWPQWESNLRPLEY